MFDKKKSAGFQNLNLCKRMSHVSKSQVTCENFGSPNTCINSGFKKRKTSLSWLDALETDRGLGDAKRKKRRKGKADPLESVGLDF